MTRDNEQNMWNQKLIDELLRYLKGMDPSLRLDFKDERGLFAWLYNLIFG